MSAMKALIRALLPPPRLLLLLLLLLVGGEAATFEMLSAEKSVKAGSLSQIGRHGEHRSEGDVK
eukprot:243171-Hanusia_phi.AAC.1